MSALAKKLKKAFTGKQEIEFKPTSPMDRLAAQGIKPLIMTESLENRVALMTNLKSILDDVYNGKTLDIQLQAIDRALPLVLTISQAWGRGLEVWQTFSAQFRELRTMPAFMDTLVEEFLDMINHGWIPMDIPVQTPIVIFTPTAQRPPFDMREFEESTRRKAEEREE